jgi:hypothetical protein
MSPHKQRIIKEMALTVRMIVTNATGDPVAILGTRRLRAKTLRDAKVEANRRQRALNHLAPNMLEIFDDSGEILTRRRHSGKHAQTSWS